MELRKARKAEFICIPEKRIYEELVRAAAEKYGCDSGKLDADDTSRRDPVNWTVNPVAGGENSLER